MAADHKPAPHRVRLFPSDYYYGGVAAVERLVDHDVAQRLLAVPHPAFTTTGTPGPGPVLEDDTDLRQHLPELYAPVAAVVEAPNAQ